MRFAIEVNYFHYFLTSLFLINFKWVKIICLWQEYIFKFLKISMSCETYDVVTVCVTVTLYVLWSISERSAHIHRGLLYQQLSDEESSSFRTNHKSNAEFGKPSVTHRQCTIILHTTLSPLKSIFYIILVHNERSSVYICTVMYTIWNKKITRNVW